MGQIGQKKHPIIQHNLILSTFGFFAKLNNMPLILTHAEWKMAYIFCITKHKDQWKPIGHDFVCAWRMGWIGASTHLFLRNIFVVVLCTYIHGFLSTLARSILPFSDRKALSGMEKVAEWNLLSSDIWLDDLNLFDWALYEKAQWIQECECCKYPHSNK